MTLQMGCQNTHWLMNRYMHDCALMVGLPTTVGGIVITVEHVWRVDHARVPVSGKVCVPKAGSQWFTRVTRVYLGKDTEADEVIVGLASGVKVRTVKRRAPSQQWNALIVMKMISTPWQPRGEGVELTAFVMPQDLGMEGRLKPPPGLKRVEEEPAKNVELEDFALGPTERVTEQDLMLTDGTDRAFVPIAREATDEAPRESPRIDPDVPSSEPSTKQMKISAVHHMVAGVVHTACLDCWSQSRSNRPLVTLR